MRCGPSSGARGRAGRPAAEIARARADWEKAYAEASAEAPERSERFSTVSDAPVTPLYTPLDVEGLDYPWDLGFPGEFPYTRGVQPTLYHRRLWTMRRFSGFGTAEDTNRRFHYLLEQGQTGLSVAFHWRAPTRPSARRWGRVAVSSAGDGSTKPPWAPSCPPRRRRQGRPRRRG